MGEGLAVFNTSYACGDRFSNEIFILRHGYYKIKWRRGLPPAPGFD